MPISSPTDIAGCKLWLAANAITGLADGDPISTWSDASGVGNHATATLTTRPLYKTGILNGLPVVRFDGSNDALLLSGITLGDFSAFAVVKTGGGDYALMGATGPNPQLRMGQTTNKLSTFDSSNNPQSSTLGTALTSFSTVEYLRAVTTVSFYQNGTAYSTGSMAGSQTFTRIGEIASSLRLNGDIAEIVFYDSALSAGNRQDVEAYLNTKWFVGGGGGVVIPVVRHHLKQMGIS